MKIIPKPGFARSSAIKAWLLATSLLLVWAGLLWLGSRVTWFVGWPLGVLAGTLLQKGMLRLRQRAIQRCLLPHPAWNDRIGDWLLCRPFLTRLDVERSKLLGGAETNLQKEEESWLRLLPRWMLALSGLTRLMILDFDAKWATRERTRGRLAPLSIGLALSTTALWLIVLILTSLTGTFGEFFLFWVVPYTCLLPYFERRDARSSKGRDGRIIKAWRPKRER